MILKRVFCLGVFDILHDGHLILLEKAASLGELTVGVVCDDAVRMQKGADRPIQKEQFRMKLISKLNFVHEVCLLENFAFPKHILEEFDIIIVGADQHHIKNLYAIPEAKRYNLPRTEGISTSDIAKRIKSEPT